jgi:aryl-alcohol dehydrogenase-like predicted oxidoreductase
LKYRNIPTTSLNPSVICLGGGPLGVDLSKETSFALLDRFYAGGGNFIDTALVYGEWLPDGKGLSEKTIGNWLKARSNRSEIIIGTKGAHPRLSTMQVGRLSEPEISADLDESLQNLQTGYIDLYWLHRDDPSRPVAEILTILNEQVRAGKIRYFGCSNWSESRIREAQEYAAAHGLQPFAGDQVMYSFATPNPAAITDQTLVTMNAGLKTYHQSSGLAAMAYNSQARGFFAKIDLAGGAVENLAPSLRKTYANPENLQKYARLKHLSATLGWPVSALSLAYLLAQPFPVYPISGSTTLAQLQDNLQAANIGLDPSQVAFLERGE